LSNDTKCYNKINHGIKNIVFLILIHS